MNKLNDAKILLWDMETLPYIAMVWGMWKQNINAQQVIKDRSIICISYKWLNDTEVHSVHIGEDYDQFKADPYNCDHVVERFIPVLNEADFAVAHNGDRFDYPILKAHQVIHNLESFRVRKVDTLRMAKGVGQFPQGSRLDNLARLLGVSRKNATRFQMWRDIALHSDDVALGEMVHYCEQDVRVLEDVFKKLWPHCEHMLPHIGMLTGGKKEGDACPRCGGWDYVKYGRYIKNVLVYQRYRCKDCGSTFIGRKALKD